jgi:hypothetical protein
LFIVTGIEVGVDGSVGRGGVMGWGVG